LASGAIAAVRLRAVKAARIIFFIGILHLWSGGMSGFDGGEMGLWGPDDNAASQHWSYALNAGDITKPCAVRDLWACERWSQRSTRRPGVDLH
jgi:hypothetical protein